MRHQVWVISSKTHFLPFTAVIRKLLFCRRFKVRSHYLLNVDEQWLQNSALLLWHADRTRLRSRPMNAKKSDIYAQDLLQSTTVKFTVQAANRQNKRNKNKATSTKTWGKSKRRNSSTSTRCFCRHRIPRTAEALANIRSGRCERWRGRGGELAREKYKFSLRLKSLIYSRLQRGIL